MSGVINFLLMFFTNQMAGLVVGMFIGWHVPMPDWVKQAYPAMIDWVVNLFKTSLGWIWSKITGN